MSKKFCVKSSLYVRNESYIVPVLTFPVGKLLLVMGYSCQLEIWVKLIIEEIIMPFTMGYMSIKL